MPLSPFRTITGALFLAGLVGSGSIQPVHAREEPEICGPRAVIIDRLAARFEEQQTAVGMTSGGSLVEFFLSPAGTWTFVHTNAEGLTCLLAAGEDWEPITDTPRMPKPAAS